ncbi:hypothetical protein [Panacagrimonas sp.]|uniref:hypothetical protein n=1 Tax=Panacagrimonas sp. TaxID=2480088 RepID=UPI003B521B94
MNNGVAGSNVQKLHIREIVASNGKARDSTNSTMETVPAAAPAFAKLAVSPEMRFRGDDDKRCRSVFLCKYNNMLRRIRLPAIGISQRASHNLRNNTRHASPRKRTRAGFLLPGVRP